MNEHADTLRALARFIGESDREASSGVTVAQIEAIAAHVEAAREALRLFARHYEITDCEEHDPREAVEVPIADLRRARKAFAALSPAPAPVSVSRDWTEDQPHENGNYSNLCCQCGNAFIGHKRRVVCKACATTALAPVSGERAAALLEAERIVAKHETGEQVCERYTGGLRRARMEIERLRTGFNAPAPAERPER